MKSPFPGLDPYLQHYWRDIHHSLITYARDQLQGQLPGGLQARIEERVFLELPDNVEQSRYPDVFVAEYPHGGTNAGGVAVADADVAVAEPVIVQLKADPATQGYLEIIDAASGGKVITVIEFVSPSNKRPGEGKDLYKAKQRECFAAGVSLVEIDLIRGGEHVLSLAREEIPKSCRGELNICVHRGWERTRHEVYAVPLRQRLPSIRIPLRPTDADVRLDLQSLVDLAYRNGRYGMVIDYSTDPDPPLTSEDAAWADELLRSAGRRKQPGISPVHAI